MIYLRPAYGGIFDYSEALLGIMREYFPPAEIEVVTVRPDHSPFQQGLRLARQLGGRAERLYVDLGAGDPGLLWALHWLSGRLPTVVTLHDPKVVVGAIFRTPPLGPFRRAKTLVDKLLFRANRSVAPVLVRRVLARCQTVMVLNRSVPEVLGVPVQYLPQPVYRRTPQARRRPSPPMIAYLGYWGEVKGLQEVVDAFRLVGPRFPEVRFVIAGGAPPGSAEYEQSWRARITAASARIEMPGFIPPSDLDAYLDGMSALVLPYHRELAGGASAMLMRAQEAGVPLIVTDTPMLRAQVGAANVTMVPPRDAHALADAIAGVLANPEAAEAAASREQARVYAEHGHDVVAARLQEIIGATL